MTGLITSVHHAGHLNNAATKSPTATTVRNSQANQTPCSSPNEARISTRTPVRRPAVSCIAYE
jgi:hypothetical protein